MDARTSQEHFDLCHALFVILDLLQARVQHREESSCHVRGEYQSFQPVNTPQSVSTASRLTLISHLVLVLRISLQRLDLILNFQLSIQNLIVGILAIIISIQVIIISMVVEVVAGLASSLGDVADLVPNTEFL